MVRYLSYGFIDKDPIIDEVRTIVADSGMTYKQIHEASGVSIGTLVSWFGGKAKRPQAATVNAVLRTMGYKLGPMPHEIIRTEPPEPAKPSEPRSISRHAIQMARYK